MLPACSDDPAQPLPEPEPEPAFRITTISSTDYLRYRFFQLDIPEAEARGRVEGERIEPASVKIFIRLDPGTPSPWDVANMAAYVDSTGYRDWDQLDPDEPFETGFRWREIYSYSPILDFHGNLLGIDLMQAVGAEDVLVCTYEILDNQFNLIARVGDNPTHGPPTTPIMGSDELYYRMKLLKAPITRPDPHVHYYMWRNVYSLGSSSIDHSQFDLWIEANDSSSDPPDQDERGMAYIRIFGLDQEDVQGTPGADGIVDFHNPLLFDLYRGLLRFPRDFPQPFAADPQQYEDNVQSPEWSYESRSFLGEHLAPQIYSLDTLPLDYPPFGYFNIIVKTGTGPQEKGGP